MGLLKKIKMGYERLIATVEEDKKKKDTRFDFFVDSEGATDTNDADGGDADGDDADGDDVDMDFDFDFDFDFDD